MRQQPNILRDQSGAMMVMSAFMALFLVGTLYFILGVGDSVIYRRIMQDAADAGAYGASVVAARGMNLHVLLNIVMMIIAGILLIIRTVEVILEIILLILKALMATVLLAAVAGSLYGVLSPIESAVETIGDVVEEFVKIAHDALDAAHDVVQTGFPIMAQGRAIDIMAYQDAYEPPVVAGFVVPLRGPDLPDGGNGLPVEEDDIDVLCDRAAEGTEDSFSNIVSIMPDWLMSSLGGIVGSAMGLAASRVCDDDIVEPPRRVIEERESGGEVWLGHEEFQYRAYDIGEDPHNGKWQRGEKGVRLAQGAHDDGRDVVHTTHMIGQVGFAQGEYYWNDRDDKEEWMWAMKWRARLRRFRISRNLIPTGLTSACSGASGRGGVTGMLTSACDIIRDFSINVVSVH